MFKAKNIDAALDPKGVIRECCDNEEHPNTLPVILALDVTGSMGQTAVEIAKRLNEIMTKLYGQIKDCLLYTSIIGTCLVVMMSSNMQEQILAQKNLCQREVRAFLVVST